MSERDIPHKINRELFLDPAIDVDDDQEFETLRRFHEEEAEREATQREEDANAQKKP